MKKLQPNILLVIVSLILLSSCSTNRFSVRKNFQPRVSIEVDHSSKSTEALVSEMSSHSVDSSRTKVIATLDVNTEPTVKPKETIVEKIFKSTFAKKDHASIDKLFHPEKKKLRKAQDAKMDGDKVPGLVLGIISMLLAIASYMMIIVMAKASIWTGFIIGLLLAAGAIAVGFIGKQFPFRGLAIAGGILGIVAVFVLMVFLILIILGIIY